MYINIDILDEIRWCLAYLSKEEKLSLFSKLEAFFIVHSHLKVRHKKLTWCLCGFRGWLSGGSHWGWPGLISCQVGWVVSRPDSQCSGSSRNEGLETPLCRATLSVWHLFMPVLTCAGGYPVQGSQPGLCWGRSLDSAALEEVIWVFSSFWFGHSFNFLCSPFLTSLSLETHRFLFWVLWGFQWTLASFCELLLLKHSTEWRIYTLQSVICTW